MKRTALAPSNHCHEHTASRRQSFGASRWNTPEPFRRKAQSTHCPSFRLFVLKLSHRVLVQAFSAFAALKPPKKPGQAIGRPRKDFRTTDRALGLRSRKARSLAKAPGTSTQRLTAAHQLTMESRSSLKPNRFHIIRGQLNNEPGPKPNSRTGTARSDDSGLDGLLTTQVKLKPIHPTS